MLGLVMVVSVIDDYAATVGITLKAAYDAENLSGAMSLVASTGGVTLFPLYVQNMLTPNVVSPRPSHNGRKLVRMPSGQQNSTAPLLSSRFSSCSLARSHLDAERNQLIIFIECLQVEIHRFTQRELNQAAQV